MQDRSRHLPKDLADIGNGDYQHSSDWHVHRVQDIDTWIVVVVSQKFSRSPSQASLNCFLDWKLLRRARGLKLGMERM